jgi:ribonuclease Y
MDWQISYNYLATVILASMALGYAFFSIMRLMLPKRLRAEHLEQREIVIQKAMQRRKQIVHEADLRTNESLALNLEEIDDQLADLKQDLEASEAELKSQEEFASKEESRVAKLENQTKAYEQKVMQVKEALEEKRQEQDRLQQSLRESLAQTADCDLENIRENLKEDLLNKYRLESQKRLKLTQEELATNQKKLADRTLSRLLARYEPQFVWPKATSHVEITNNKLLDQLSSDQTTLLTDLMEQTDQVEISLAQDENSNLAAIKLGGGYGIDKEAARLTLEEIVPKGPNAWHKASKVYQKHHRQLENQARILGRRAVEELKIDDLHPEIQKMVGALNWRTSYRQNQYYHSLEVAKLAGILAYELGVDPQLAKRCGLLHDIGKGIDYRIDGSHAVISGDYADRFGESKLICDTVMSHHNDLVLETPLSYVLKSADTLSGARPGARVNLEEGYQIRLSAIEEVVRSFPGITKVAIMNGGREVHVDVNHKKVKEHELKEYTASIARKIEEDVAFPGQIRVLVSRRFESVAVA